LELDMTLRDALEHRGRWLFKYRGHLPLLLVPVFAAALANAPAVPGSRIAWEVFCLAFAFTGLGVRAATVGFVPARTSGRNTASQVADALNTSGMYSLVRHPLYLGNAIVLLGVTLLFSCWWLVLIVLLAFGLYYERIMLAEEEFLRRQFGAAFEAWAARVPAVVPRLHGWQRPALPFSLRTVIRREYHGAVAILAAFAALHYLGDLAVARQLSPDPRAVGYALVAALVFAICRYLKKRTGVLRVQGR
jgi:protein-S-isoprenylcysteine O-methyltransferase Ste14